jgi:hypothetical protein
VWIQNNRFALLLGETYLWALPAGVLLTRSKNPLMVILLFKDDESHVDSESSYALSRRVTGCPSTKFGFWIPLKIQALPATAYIALDFWLLHFCRTPRQFNYVSLASRTPCVNSKPLHHRLLRPAPPWRLPPATRRFLLHWCIVHSRPSACSPPNYSIIFLSQNVTTTCILFNAFF